MKLKYKMWYQKSNMFSHGKLHCANAIAVVVVTSLSSRKIKYWYYVEANGT
jgi:hypothetical protein